MKKRYCITATAFDRSGRVIASAVNSYESSTALMRYYAMKTGNPKKVFTHAEIGVLGKAMKLRKIVDKIVIVRYDSNGKLKNAKPCSICSTAIRDFGIRKVLYSTPEGMMEL